MRFYLLIVLGFVCALTAAIYFGGHALFPIEDTHEQLLQYAEANQAKLEGNRSQSSEPSSDGQGDETPSEEKVLPKIETDEQLREAYAQFNQKFEAADFKEAIKWIRLLVEHQPDNISYLLQQGDVAFFVGQFDESVQAYDQAISLAPEQAARLWQRGLALYYAEKFQDGVKQFELHQTVNSQDVENAVWHFLCKARATDIDNARKSLIEIQQDARIPMAEIFEMFAGKREPQNVLEAFGSADGTESPNANEQYYANLYVGLYLESIGESQKSLEAMKAAVEICPIPRGNFMGEVARVHVAARGK